MDSIRLSQINEALNYDKNINAMVFNLEKKRTAQFPDPEVLPYSQLGEETMTSTKDGSNSLKVLLEAKIAIVVQFTNVLDKASAVNIGQVQPLIQAYNQVVAPYASTQITQQTKEAILTEVRYLLGRLGDLKKALQQAIRISIRSRMFNYAAKYCVVALAVAEIMDKQIKTAKLFPINDDDIQREIDSLLNENANWRQAMATGDDDDGDGGGPPPPSGNWRTRRPLRPRPPGGCCAPG